MPRPTSKRTLALHLAATIAAVAAAIAATAASAAAAIPPLAGTVTLTTPRWFTTDLGTAKCGGPHEIYSQAAPVSVSGGGQGWQFSAGLGSQLAIETQQAPGSSETTDAIQLSALFNATAPNGSTYAVTVIAGDTGCSSLPAAASVKWDAVPTSGMASGGRASYDGCGRASDLTGAIGSRAVTIQLGSCKARPSAAVKPPSIHGAATPLRPPVLTTLPELKGRPVIGEKLHVVVGGLNASDRLAYTWQRCMPGAVVCRTIPGASGSDYTVAAVDAGHQLRAEVQIVNDAGSVSTDTPASATVLPLGAPVRPGQLVAVRDNDRRAVLYRDSGYLKLSFNPGTTCHVSTSGAKVILDYQNHGMPRTRTIEFERFADPDQKDVLDVSCSSPTGRFAHIYTIRAATSPHGASCVAWAKALRADPDLPIGRPPTLDQDFWDTLFESLRHDASDKTWIASADMALLHEDAMYIHRYWYFCDSGDGRPGSQHLADAMGQQPGDFLAVLSTGDNLNMPWATVGAFTANESAVLRLAKGAVAAIGSFGASVAECADALSAFGGPERVKAALSAVSYSEAMTSVPQYADAVANFSDKKAIEHFAIVAGVDPEKVAASLEMLTGVSSCFEAGGSALDIFHAYQGQG